VPNQSIWYGDNQTVTCTASDTGSGLANSGDATFSLSTNVSSGHETDSAQTASKTVYDNVGHHTTVDPYTYMIDRKAPQLSSCDSPDGNWHGSNITLHCTYTDGGSGPASQQVALTTSVDAGNETSNATASAGGAQACDAVNNCAASPTDITGNKVDRKAPQLSSCDSPDGSWHGSNITLHCTYTDGGSGPASQQVALTTSVDAGNETSNAAASAGAQACDAVNNCAASPSDITGNKIDRNSPAISDKGTTQPPTGNDGIHDWYNHDVTVNFSATDGGSGVACSSPWTETTSGEGNDVTVSSGDCADNVGNGNNAIPSSGYHIDKSNPTVSCTAPNQTVWYGTNQSVNCTASDSGAGLANSADASFTLSTSVAAGAETSTASTGSKTVSDSAGNSTTVGPYTYKIDLKAPLISNNGTPDAPTGFNGVFWYNHDVPVSFSATDGGSGVFCTSPWTKTTTDEGNNVTVSSGDCADNVGNGNNAIPSSAYHIDKTKPTVSVTGVSIGATYTLGSVPAAGCTTGDSLSGVATYATLSTSGGPVGSVTAICSGAADNAGNSNSASVTYSVDYNWSGFFQPVNNPTDPAPCNTVKAGSAIPVKFTLHGYQGMNILATGSPTWTIGSCSGTDDAITSTETVTAGNSSLSYDATSDQYVYVWKTDKTWAGKSMRLTVTLADGMPHYARFIFTK
jgi:hypothetical protein